MFKFKLIHFFSEDIALALIIWICTLPLVALLIAPLLGTRIAVLTALVLFIVIMAVCWGVCGWKVVHGDDEIL